MDQLKYVQTLDIFNDMEEDETELLPTLMTGHKTVKHHGHCKVYGLVQFYDGDMMWTDVHALRIDHPFVMISYVLKNRLVHLPDFTWVKECCDDDKKLQEVRKAFKAKIDL